jgi:hypothetical protein
MKRALLVVAVLGSVVAADPKKPDKPKDKPKPETNEPGRSKRAASEDYDPKSAPTRIAAGKKVVLPEVVISGRIQKPEAFYLAATPPGPRAEPPRGLPPEVIAAIDVVEAADAFFSARAYQLAKYPPAKPLAADARWQAADTDVRARAVAILRPFVEGARSGAGLAAATIALLRAAEIQSSDDPVVAVARGALARTTGGDRRALAFALLAYESSDAVLTLACNTTAVPADLSRCTAEGLDRAQAAYVWQELGRVLDSTALAPEAYARAVPLVPADQLSAVQTLRGDALREVHRLDEAALAFEAARVAAVAVGDGMERDHAEGRLAWVLRMPRDASEDRDRDGLADAAISIARADTVFAREPDEPARSRVLVGIADSHVEQLDREGAASLLEAALAAGAHGAELERVKTRLASLSTRAPGIPFDAKTVFAVVARSQTKLAECVGRGRASAVVKLNVSAAGDVLEASVTGLVGDPAICVATMARRWLLPAPGARVSLEVPLSFASQE